jgi:hypothetical protein
VYVSELSYENSAAQQEELLALLAATYRLEPYGEAEGLTAYQAWSR